MPPKTGDTLRLIVGLANPGQQYSDTRHNAGEWFVEAIARQFNANLQADSKFFGHTARLNLHGEDVRLLIPTTYMNKSGQAVAAIAKFYKITPQQILVAHDELDMPPGVAKFKTGGGHGGHNGLRDIIQSLGNNKQFHRLRIGIGHPGSADLVTGYVLGKPSIADRQKIDGCVDAAVDALALAIAGDWAKAMNQLHSYKA